MLGHHRHASEMAFRWRADDGPLIVVLDSFYSQEQAKKTTQKRCHIWAPFDKLSGSAHLFIGYDGV